MPVSDPESSRPATCAGAGLASTRFPDSSHGAAGTWLGMWGRWEGKSAITRTGKLAGMLQLSPPW